MKVKILFGLLFSLLTLFVAGCGGGGGSGSGGGGTTAAPTTVTIKLATTGNLGQGVSINVIDVNLLLPTGVTVATDSQGIPTTEAVALSGVWAVPARSAQDVTIFIPTFTPAAGATPAKVNLSPANTLGFGIGEFATVKCNITAGTLPAASDFSLVTNSITNANAVPLTPAISAAISSVTFQ